MRGEEIAMVVEAAAAVVKAFGCGVFPFGPFGARALTRGHTAWLSTRDRRWRCLRAATTFEEAMSTARPNSRWGRRAAGVEWDGGESPLALVFALVAVVF